MFIGSSAFADHPFDPHRYAFELFSEDESALSKLAEAVPEAEVEPMLTRAWSDLDRAADQTAGLSPEEAKKRIQEAVRGPDGISTQFHQQVSSIVEQRKAGRWGRVTQALRHPAVWGLAVLFAVGLVLINHRRA